MAQPHQNHDSNLLSKQREEPCCISKTERLKPPHSYIALIATAILNSPGKKLTLTEINDYLIQHYAFFRGPYQGWKNSVRHNLSFNKCFVKILRDPARPWGKDNYWTVSSLHDYLLADGTFRRRRRRKPKRKYGRDDVSNQFLTNGVARELRVHDAQRSVLMLPRYEFLADRVHSSASQATCPSTTSVPFQGSFSIESILSDRKPNQEREKSRARKAGTFPDSSVANTNINPLPVHCWHPSQTTSLNFRSREHFCEAPVSPTIYSAACDPWNTCHCFHTCALAPFHHCY